MAQRAPGLRPIRSIGPDTDTAAITAPRPSRTGAETLATPGSRSAALCAQPRLRTSASVRSVNFAVGNTACCAAASAYASSTLAPEPAVIGSLRADRHRIAKPGRWFQGRYADARRAFATVELDALAGDLPQPRQHDCARGQQRIVDLPCQFGQRGAEPPSAVFVTDQQPVDFQARGQPVCGGPWQAGALAKVGEPTRRVRHRMQHAHRFVQHADAAILSHREILASQNVRKSRWLPK